jgi:hypothetical protein
MAALKATEGHQRRLVVYIGPPKTASTSLQSFLAKYATKGGKRAKAFEGWQYPMFLGAKSGIRYILDGYDDPSFGKIRNEFQRQNTSVNLVVASEYLIYYGTMLNGHIFDLLSNWTNVAIPEVVIQSRSPRIGHLISTWKQQTKAVKTRAWHGWSFHQYMCSNVTETVVTERLGHFVNPIGVAHDMVHKYQLPTYVMDIKGVSQHGLDVCHAFACSIMKVNCTEGNITWVQGLEGVTIHDNSRVGNPQLSSEQKTEMEKIFDQRDCAYRDDLYNHSLFQLLYQHDGFWPEHCTKTKAMPVFRYNASVMLNEFRRILRCPGYESGHIQQDFMPEESKTYISLPNALPVQAAAYLVLALIVLGMRLHARQRQTTGSVNQDEGKASNR